MFQLSFAAREEDGPLYDQLYRAIVAQIRQGSWPPASGCPASAAWPRSFR